MRSNPKKTAETPTPHPPARTSEGRQNQLISLAFDLAEKQLLDGTASAQVIAQLLKLGTEQSKLEKEKLVRENALLLAKTESLQSMKRVEELYVNALNAMRSYSGQQPEESNTEEEDY